MVATIQQSTLRPVYTAYHTVDALKQQAVDFQQLANASSYSINTVHTCRTRDVHNIYVAFTQVTSD